MARLCGTFRSAVNLAPESTGYREKAGPPGTDGPAVQGVKIMVKTESSGGRTTRAHLALHVDDEIHQPYLTVSETLADALCDDIPVGQHVCFFYFRHLLRKKCLVGAVWGKDSRLMPLKGVIFGSFWYIVVNPVLLAIPLGLGGMMIGMLGGRAGSAGGLMAGVVLSFAACWTSAIGMCRAYQEALGYRRELRSGRG